MKQWMGVLCLLSFHSSGSMAAADPADGPLTFTVLSYQVETAAPKHFPTIGARLDAFDIAGIQGCFARCETLLAAAHHPNKYYFKDRPHWWNRANSGLASLSKFPLIEVKKIHYSAQANLVDDDGSKGVLLMRYDVDGHILDVYNTEMQPGKQQMDLAARQFQTMELIHYVEQESPAEHTVILIGDFGAEKTRPMIKGKLNLHDTAEQFHGWLENHEDRVLYRSGSNTVFRPIAWKDMSGVFVDGAGAPFSASAPIAVQFSLE